MIPGATPNKRGRPRLPDAVRRFSPDQRRFIDWSWSESMRTAQEIAGDIGATRAEVVAYLNRRAMLKNRAARALSGAYRNV